MSDMKVKDLADTVGITPERLVDQLNEAGIKVSKPDDLITEDQKQSLLQFLQQRHGKSASENDASPKKITLKRKSVSEIKLGGGTSRQAGKSVSVEVRKKRTFVKRSDAEPTTASAPAEEPVIASQAQVHAEEVARQEQLRQQEIARKQQEQTSLQKEESEREAAAVAAAIEAERLADEEARLAAEEEQKALAEEAKLKEEKKSVAAKKQAAKPELTASQLAHKKLEEADALPVSKLKKRLKRGKRLVKKRKP
jgi:translation initiation factor IF-2